MNPFSRRLATNVFLVLACLFVLASMFAVFMEAVYIPYWDQWDWYRRYLLKDESPGSLAFTPINGHIVALPSLFYRADIALFRASNVANLTVLLACLLGTSAVLWKAFAKLPSARDVMSPTVFAACTAILMLWFHNWENLFWPFQVHLYISVFLASAGLYALASVLGRREPSGVATGIAASVVAGLLSSTSFGAGVGFWSAGLVLVLISGSAARWKLLAAATAFGIVGALALYAGGAAMRTAGPADVSRMLHFFVTYFGSPFYAGGNARVLVGDARSLSAVVGFGYLAIALTLVLAFRLNDARRRRPLSTGELFFVGMGLFSLSSGVLAAAARSAGDLASPALSSRYGVFSLLFWISAVPLLLTTFPATARWQRAIAAVAPLGLLALLALSQNEYLHWWAKWRNNVQWAQTSLESAVPDRGYLGYVFPADRQETVEAVTSALLREGLSPIAFERRSYIGRSIAEFGPPTGSCAAPAVRVHTLPAGLRLTGQVTDRFVPFAHRRVLVTDAGGTIIGVGAVERSWPSIGELLTVRSRSDLEFQWVAHAPTRSGDDVRVYVSRSSGLCMVAQGPLPPNASP